jgi:hypothetical protein
MTWGSAAPAPRAPRNPRSSAEEDWGQRAAGVAHRVLRDIFGGARNDDLAALLAAFGAEVDHEVGLFDDVGVVLDHDDGVAAIHQPVQDVEELLDVGEVGAGGGLVEQVEGAPGALARELLRELDALGLASPSCEGRGFSDPVTLVTLLTLLLDKGRGEYQGISRGRRLRKEFSFRM